MSAVRDYRTGQELDGDASAALIEASLDAAPTGVVEAYFAGSAWYPLTEENREQVTRLGYEVRTVYVEVSP